MDIFRFNSYLKFPIKIVIFKLLIIIKTAISKNIADSSPTNRNNLVVNVQLKMKKKYCQNKSNTLMRRSTWGISFMKYDFNLIYFLWFFFNNFNKPSRKSSLVL